jgi:hypothetical protein
LKSEQPTKAPEFARVATDHRDPGIDSPSELIDPPSASRFVVSAWAEQLRPLLLDPAIIAEPAGSAPEAASHTVETSRALPHRAVSNLNPDEQERSGPRQYQPQWQTISEIENLNRFTPGEREAALIPGSTERSASPMDRLIPIT